MAKTSKPSGPSKIVDNRLVDDAAKKPPAPRAVDDEDAEDGDMATPKRDRYGNDDEPL